jgi:hypothetical protein
MSEKHVFLMSDKEKREAFLEEYIDKCLDIQDELLEKYDISEDDDIHFSMYVGLTDTKTDIHHSNIAYVAENRLEIENMVNSIKNTWIQENKEETLFEIGLN